MNRIRIVLALAVAAMLAGCGTLTTKYPIGTTTGLVQDNELIGTWKGHFVDSKVNKPDTPPFYLHFLRFKDNTMIAIWVAPHFIEKNDDGAALLFRITNATLGNNNYINAAEMDVGGNNTRGGHGTTPVLYRLDGNGGLQLFALNKDKLLKAPGTGGLAVETTHHKSTFVSYDDVEITSEPAGLDAFMATPEAAAMFEPWIVLKKAD